LESLQALDHTLGVAARLREERWTLLDLQLCASGLYELQESRYELLCGLQGAGGVADPMLLGTFLDAPAGFSRAGRGVQEGSSASRGSRSRPSVRLPRSLVVVE
jgi:hypothetical protein